MDIFGLLNFFKMPLLNNEIAKKVNFVMDIYRQKARLFQCQKYYV